MTPALFASIAAAGFAVTYAWRLLGVLAVKRIDPESDLLLWVRALATALVAALVVRLVVSPSGPLAETTEIAEGVKNSLVVRRLARERGIEMPIIEQMVAVMYEGKSPRQSVDQLMRRELRSEAAL